jgi:hypothetical protein
MAYASRTYPGAGGGAQTFALTNTDGNAIGYIRESDIKVTVGTTVYTNAASGTNTYQFSGTSTLETLITQITRLDLVYKSSQIFTIPSVQVQEI